MQIMAQYATVDTSFEGIVWHMLGLLRHSRHCSLEWHSRHRMACRRSIACEYSMAYTVVALWHISYSIPQ